MRVRGLTRRFGSASAPVLDGLDLDIARGEFVALLGRSGSGKTTLLRTLAGLDPVTEGSVTAPRKRAVVFQEPRLLPWKRVRDNVRLGLSGADVLQLDEPDGDGQCPGQFGDLEGVGQVGALQHAVDLYLQAEGQCLIDGGTGLAGVTAAHDRS